jgi:hypothetical protein
MLLFSETIDRTARLVIAIASAGVYGLGVLALLTAYCSYRCPQVRAKHLPMLTFAYLGSILWYAGFLHANGIVSRIDSWDLCNIWYVWAFFVFGVMLHLSVLIMRLYSLHKVFVQQGKVAFRHYAVLSTAIYTPALALGFAVTLLPEYGVDYNVNIQSCTVSVIYSCAAFALAILSLCILGVSIDDKYTSLQSSANQL